jgi:hypothetical protein
MKPMIFQWYKLQWFYDEHGIGHFRSVETHMHIFHDINITCFLLLSLKCFPNKFLFLKKKCVGFGISIQSEMFIWSLDSTKALLLILGEKLLLVEEQMNNYTFTIRHRQSYCNRHNKQDLSWSVLQIYHLIGYPFIYSCIILFLTPYRG